MPRPHARTASCGPGARAHSRRAHRPPARAADHSILPTEALPVGPGPRGSPAARKIWRRISGSRADHTILSSRWA